MKTVILSALGLAALAGCGREEEASRNSGAPDGKSGSIQGASSKPEVDTVFASYEKIRTLLAEDKTEGLADAAGVLGAAAEQAEPKASEAGRAHFRGIISSATRLKEDAKDLLKARRNFGDVSRHVIGLVSAEPSFAKGRHVFLCPMTKDTYNKWVQMSPEVSNPYMGKKMPG